MKKCRKCPEMRGLLQVLALLLIWAAMYALGDPNLPPLSCTSAQIPDFGAGNGFCDFVDWWAARAYSPSNFTYFATGNAMSPYDQQSMAALFYRDLLEDITNNSRSFKNTQECVDAIYTLACMEAYPSCPYADKSDYGNQRQSISYLQTCQVHCKIVKHYCLDALIKENNIELAALSKWFQCEDYPVENCAMHLDTSLYFVLNPKRGPYEGLESLYIALLVIWLLVVSVTYRLGLTKERTRRVENLVAFMVPLLKTFVNIFALPFWSSCIQTACSRWLVNAMINVHLLYETIRVFWFFMLAKGWQVSRNTIAPNSMRNMIIGTTLFFFCATILIAFTFSNIGVIVLYGLTYAYIVGSTAHQIYMAERQKYHVASIVGEPRELEDEDEGGHAPSKIIRPIIFKRRLYYSYLLMVFLSMAGVVLVVCLDDEQESLFVMITVYELLDLVSTCALLALFRPRDLSPFYYLEVFNPEAVEETENQLQQSGTIKAFEAEAVPSGWNKDTQGERGTETATMDIETSPLIQSQSEFAEVELVPARMVVVRNPDQLRLGISHLL